MLLYMRSGSSFYLITKVHFFGRGGNAVRKHNGIGILHAERGILSACSLFCLQYVHIVREGLAEL